MTLARRGTGSGKIETGLEPSGNPAVFAGLPASLGSTLVILKWTSNGASVNITSAVGRNSSHVDQSGGTWVVFQSALSSGNNRCGFAYNTNCPANVTEIALTGASGNPFMVGEIEEWTYAGTLSKDQQNSATGPSISTPLSSGNITNSVANAVLFGVFGSDDSASGTVTQGGSGTWTQTFNEGDTSAHHAGCGGFQAVSGTGPHNYTGTYDNETGGDACCAIISFIESGSGPTITSTDSAAPQVGSTLNIGGTDFGASQGSGSVTIGGVTQTVTSWSDTSIDVTVVRGTNKHGLAVDVVVRDNALTPSPGFSLTGGLTSITGWTYVNLTTPNTNLSNRLTSTPDLASGDQIAYEFFSGAVTVSADATFAALNTIQAFQFEVWTSSGGWGSIATQEIVTQAPVPSRRPKLSNRTHTKPWLWRGWFGTRTSQLGWFSKSVILPESASGASGPTGLAIETDTAFALAGVQLRPVGLASETDSALALTSVSLRPIGLASETDSAFALAARQIRATGLAIETDTALALTSGASGAVGLATETDSAFALSARQITGVGLAVETDTALALTSVSLRPVGLAVETDSALARAAVQILPVGRADETDSALALQAAGPQPVGLAIEVDTALALAGINFGDVQPSGGGGGGGGGHVGSRWSSRRIKLLKILHSEGQSPVEAAVAVVQKAPSAEAIASVVRAVEEQAANSTTAERAWLNSTKAVLERLQREAEEEERELLELIALL